MREKTIGFIGLGFVGSATKASFEKHFKTEVLEIIKEKNTVRSVEDLAEKCKVIFVALPTPVASDGSLDMTTINKIFADLNHHNLKNIVVLKSSVPPGTTKSLSEKFTNIKFVFNPEFLTESNAVSDFANQTKVILAGEKEYVDIVKGLYQVVFPEIDIYETNYTTAEMVKFTINCFLATKVSFFNEIYQACQKLDVDFDEMRELALTDKRIGVSHSKVPGPPGTRDVGLLGWGLSCFKGNLQILIDTFKKIGVKPTMLTATIEKNKEVRPSLFES